MPVSKPPVRPRGAAERDGRAGGAAEGTSSAAADPEVVQLMGGLLDAVLSEGGYEGERVLPDPLTPAQADEMGELGYGGGR